MAIICIRCMKEINLNGNYIQLNEFSQGKIIKVNYCHKSCWEDLMDSKKKVNQAFGMVKGLQPALIKMGLIPEEKVIIQ